MKSRKPGRARLEQLTDQLAAVSGEALGLVELALCQALSRLGPSLKAIDIAVQRLRDLEEKLAHVLGVDVSQIRPRGSPLDAALARRRRR